MILSKENVAERKRILKEHAREKADMNKMISKIQKQMHLEAKRYKKNEQRLIKIIEKKNYEAFHAIPENLKNHKLQNPNSFYLQILGCRGAGKSTFINHCMKKSGFDSFDYRP